MSNLYYITNARLSVRGQKVDISQNGNKYLTNCLPKVDISPEGHIFNFKQLLTKVDISY